MSTPSPWQYFSMEELTCSCGCGRMEMDADFMARLVTLRRELGFPFPVTSGYRCPDYNDEISGTGRDGPHTTGKAVDIQVVGSEAHKLLGSALGAGITGIGVAQSGDHSGRFLHLDKLSGPTRPWIWSY